MKVSSIVCMALLAAGAMSFRAGEAVVVAAASSRADSILSAVNYQLANYPASQYRDVYKNFMQDFYGPGHILADTAAAGRYLREELAGTTSFGGPLYEPTGYRGNFYRVNLSLIRDGIVPYGLYFRNFVESVQSISMPPLEEWRAAWAEIDSVITAAGIHLGGEDTDRTMVEEVFARGGYAVHHSQQYNDAVNFHYRIISRDRFETEILPLLDEPVE